MSNKRGFEFEFIALMASLMSIVALSIDALLPALPEIGNALGVTNINDNQKMITMIFLGLGFGQLLFGTIADSFGRKPIVYSGFLLFVLASFICLTTNNFDMMIFGRVLQGVGLAALRTISMTMIRDTYDGDFMAKIISIVVMVFLLVPVIAPTLGQFLLKFYDWESIFYFNLLFGAIVIAWFYQRQPETLKPEYKIKFSSTIFINGTKEFFKHKPAVAYTLVSGFITGSFLVYLSTAQQIFEQQYDMAEQFPIIFASLAIAIGLSTYLNSRVVVRFGMWKMAYYSIIAYILISILYIVLYYSGNPSAVVLISFFAIQFFAIGFVFGNVRALAMQPLGHIAGIGAALNGFISTIMSVPIANYIGSFVKDSALPLFIGFSVFGLLSFLVFLQMKFAKS